MNIKCHPARPRIQRAFIHWLNKNRTRFEVPILLSKISADGIELRFQDCPDCLSVWLSRDDQLEIHVSWRGMLWDRMKKMWAPVQRWNRFAHRSSPQLRHEKSHREGYVCGFCLHECYVDIFSSPEALWQDHLFDPLLEWVNDELAPARWLKISCTNDEGNGGSNGAQLIRDESGLSGADRSLLELQQLKCIDGIPAYEGESEGTSNWLIPLNLNSKSQNIVETNQHTGSFLAWQLVAATQRTHNFKEKKNGRTNK